MAQRTVVFEDFSKGEWGTVERFKAPAGSWSGTNMLVYSTGEIGCRPDPAAVTNTGKSNGAVHGFGVTPVPTKEIWYCQGTALFLAPASGGAVISVTGSLATTPTVPLASVTIGTNIYITNYGDKCYKLDVGAATLTAIAGSPGGTCIGVYGDRLVVGNKSGSPEYRLFASDAADFTTWSDFIDIGDPWAITALYPQRQHLLIAKQNGYYALTGVIGDGQVVRKLKSGPGPLIANEAAFSNDDIVWAHGTNITVPTTFNGSSLGRVNHLANILTAGQGPSLPPARGVGVLNGEKSGAVFADTGEEALVYYNGSWSKHTLSTTTTGYVASGDSFVTLCDGGGASAQPAFYLWYVGADSPGRSTGSFDLPEWWAPDGGDVMVRSVIVDFRTFNYGSGNNTFNLAVRNLRKYQSDSPTASTTLSFTETASGASSAETKRRVFGLGEQGLGGGFQLQFSSCLGVAIQRVTVVYDHTPVRI